MAPCARNTPLSQQKQNSGEFFFVATTPSFPQNRAARAAIL
jgi:hypothetical protein